MIENSRMNMDEYGLIWMNMDEYAYENQRGWWLHFKPGFRKVSDVPPQ